MRVWLALCAVWVATCTAASAETFLVLPFFNLTRNANLDWIGESLAETVREALVSEGILAFSREDREEAYRRLSLRPYTQLTRATVIRLGESVDADQLIFGTYELLPADPASSNRSRGSLRIKAQILDLRKARRGAEYSEFGAIEDLARLQTHLAWQTLHYVMPDRAPVEADFRNRRPVLRVDAIESYTRGLLAPLPEQKIRLFSQAVRLEPGFSQANFQLGRLYWERKSYRPAADHLRRVVPNDARYREAAFLLGLARYKLGDFAGAAEAFRAVAEVVPLNEVWNNLAAAQSRLQSPEALQNFQRALEGDPADPDYHFNVGYALFNRGDYDGAAERFRAVLERNSADAEATTMLGRCLKRSSTGRGAPPGRSEGLERLKEQYEESAYLQLKAVLERKR